MPSGKQKQARQKAKQQAAKQKAKAREEREKEKAKVQQRKQDLKQKDKVTKEQKQQKFLQQQQYLQFSENTFVPSPVFTGSDSTCDALLKRMDRKRDAITISRALQELNEYAYSATTEQSLSKPEKVATLANLLHLYKSKLAHDNHYSVRSQALHILNEASKSVPKAWDKFMGAILSCPEGEENGVGNVIGWIYVSTCDPMAEVKRAANVLWDTLLQNVADYYSTLVDEGNIDDPVDAQDMLYATVWNHLLSILQVSIRPHKLNQAFFDTKKGDKEEMEERFERVVLTTLRAMNKLMSTSTHTDIFTLHENIQLAYRNMASHRGNFRLATYSLTSTICSTLFMKSTAQDHEQSKEHLKIITPLLLRALSFEKDPANFPKLLELFLFYMSSLRHINQDIWNFAETKENNDEGQQENDKSGVSNDEEIEVTLNVFEFIQGLTNSLGVVFYGCPANQWAPSMLPLFAALPKEEKELQLQFLTCLWKSRLGTSNSMDVASIAASVAECASFLLLRRRSEGELSHEDFPKNIAQFFLDSLSHYLGGSVRDMHTTWVELLVDTLSRDLVKLDTAFYTNKTDCDIHSIQSWFWNQISSIVLSEKYVNNPKPMAVSRMTRFIRKIMNIKDAKSDINVSDEQKSDIQNEGISHLHRIFGNLFQSLSSKLDTRLPDEEESSLFLSIFEFCGVVNVFLNDTDSDDVAVRIEKFCMNDLLRWIILRTSTASHIKPCSDTAIETDFHILLECIQSFSDLSYRKKVWECILNELIKARCELGKLSLGLAVLSTDCLTDGKESFICGSDKLETLAIDVGKLITLPTDYNNDASEKSTHLESILHHSSNSSLLLFLQTCVGLAPGLSDTMFLNPSTIKSWIHCVCSTDSKKYGKDMNPVTEIDSDEEEEKSDLLLRVLLDLASKNIASSMFLNDDIIQLALIAWRKGGNIWYKSALDMLLGEHGSSSTLSDKSNEIINGMINVASCDIKNEAKETSFQSSMEDVELDSRSFAWSQRAGRLLQLYGFVKENGNSNVTSISVVGLGDVDVWQNCLGNVDTKFSDKLYLSLIYLLQSIKDNKERRNFIGITNEEPSELFLLICLSFAQPKYELTQCNKVQFSRCRILIDILGGIEAFTENFIEKFCFQLVEMMEKYLKLSLSDQKTNKILARAIVVLDWMLEMSIGEAKETGENDDSVNPNDVTEGDILWYVTNPHNGDMNRIKVQVIKIHTDDFPNLYFTVRLQDGTESTERQTVASRLKKDQASVARKLRESQIVFRQNIETKIVDKLIKPNISNILNEEKVSSTIQIVAELLNVVISRCGLKGKGGIGSVRHDVYKILSSFENCIENRIRNSNLDDNAALLIRYFAIALGFGDLSAACDSCACLNFSPSRVFTTLSNFFLDDERETGTETFSFVESVLMLLQVSVMSLSEHESSRLMELVNVLTRDILNSDTLSKTTESNFLSLSCISTKVLDLTQKSISRFPKSNFGSSFYDAEEVYLSNIIHCFVNLWTDNKAGNPILGAFLELRNDTLDENETKPVWFSSFKHLIMRNISIGSNSFIGAIFSNSDGICQILHSKSKSWLGFQLMSVLVQNSEKYCAEEVLPSSKTTQNLNKWKRGMDIEEAEELEEDILTAAQWLPQHVMNELESWRENPICDDSMDIENTMSRMLQWLLCLDFLDHSASIDMRNRSHISSYIQQTGAMIEILGSALKYAKLENKKDSSSWMTCLAIENEKNFEISDVSTVVVFRSVEVLPTLVKTWWTDYCPRSMQNTVSQFVQSKIAPEALRRELVRINNATTLGEMNVNGSCVSREVIATYVQDECELSVTIKIPQSFPLRNVEVDCKKTLGIGEKRWRHWSLQIMRMLNKDDGSVLDALMLWKQNVEKEFDGVEPCPVCYSVLCVKTHAMPNLECKTCKNRFHSTCLYKWFHSSGKSQCVLCQEPWSGTKIS